MLVRQRFGPELNTARQIDAYKGTITLVFGRPRMGTANRCLNNCFLIPALGYLVDGRANDFNIDFTRFRIRDMDTGSVLFEIAKPDSEDETMDHDDEDPNSGRYVRYRFSPDFLRLNAVGAT